MNIGEVVKNLALIVLGAVLLKILIEVVIIDTIKNYKLEKQKKEVANELKNVFMERLESYNKENSKK